MKIKIIKSAGVIYKNDVIVVQLGKEMDLDKSLANHLIKNNIAEKVEEIIEETKKESKKK